MVDEVTTLLKNSRESDRLEKLYNSVEDINDNLDDSLNKSNVPVLNKLDIMIGGQRLYYKHRVNWDNTYGIKMIEYLASIDTNTKSLTADGGIPALGTTVPTESENQEDKKIKNSIFTKIVDLFNIQKLRFVLDKKAADERAREKSTSEKPDDERIKFLDKLKETLLPKEKGLGDYFDAKTKGIMGVFSKAGKIGMLLAATYATVKSAVDGITNIFAKTSEIGSYFGKSNMDLSFTESAIGGLVLFFEGVVESVSKMVSFLTGGMIETIDVDPKAIVQSIDSIGDKIADMIVQGIYAVKDFFSQKNLLKKVVDKTKAAGSGILKFFKDPFGDKESLESGAIANARVAAAAERRKVMLAKRRNLQIEVDDVLKPNSITKPVAKLANVKRPSVRELLKANFDKDFPLASSRKEGQKARSMYKVGGNTLNMMKESELNKIKASAQQPNVIVNTTNNTNNAGGGAAVKSTTIMDSDLTIQALGV